MTKQHKKLIVNNILDFLSEKADSELCISHDGKHENDPDQNSRVEYGLFVACGVAEDDIYGLFDEVLDNEICEIIGEIEGCEELVDYQGERYYNFDEIQEVMNV